MSSAALRHESTSYFTKIQQREGGRNGKTELGRKKGERKKGRNQLRGREEEGMEPPIRSDWLPACLCVRVFGGSSTAVKSMSLLLSLSLPSFSPKGSFSTLKSLIFLGPVFPQSLPFGFAFTFHHILLSCLKFPPCSISLILHSIFLSLCSPSLPPKLFFWELRGTSMSP